MDGDGEEAMDGEEDKDHGDGDMEDQDKGSKEAGSDAVGSDAGEEQKDGSMDQTSKNMSLTDQNIKIDGDDGEDRRDESESNMGKSLSSTFGKKFMKSKKKGKGDTDFVVLPISLKSTVVKGRTRFVVNEKVETPFEILEYVKANYPEGVNSLTEDDIYTIVDDMYTKAQKKKLIVHVE